MTNACAFWKNSRRGEWSRGDAPYCQPRHIAHAAAGMWSPIEILYNGVCPVCRAGACDLERRAAAARAGVIFTDVAAIPAALERAGVTLDEVRLKLHALTPDGRVLRGMPAVALAWRATPPFQFLGRISSLPPFSWVAAGLYHATAHILWSWNRACGRW